MGKLGVLGLNANSAGLPHLTLSLGTAAEISESRLASRLRSWAGDMTLSVLPSLRDLVTESAHFTPPLPRMGCSGLCLPCMDWSLQHEHVAPLGLLSPLKPLTSPTLSFSYEDETYVYDDLISASVSQLLRNLDDRPEMTFMSPLKSLRAVSARGGMCRRPCFPLPARPQRPS